MRTAFVLTALALATAAHAADMNALTGEEKATGWQLLFDGKTLDGWRASDAPGSFSVKDGAIVVRGPRSHLFYVGPVQQHEFRNFEFKADVMTFAKANSGVYFHTRWQEVGWPNLGYEVQVNNSHSDLSRTGGLWGVQDFPKVIAADGTWFTLTVRVEGKHVTTFVGTEKTADYVEESPIVRKKGLEQRFLASGTFALQGHDPESEVHFRSIKVRVLP
ncbi:3-keto-disaccharide hydrolase [Roseateles sp. P5_E7]